MSFGAPCVAHRVWAIPTDPSRTDFDTRFSSTETFVKVIKFQLLRNVESEKISILDYENALKIMTNLGKLDIVENKDYYNSLIEIPDDAYRLENKKNRRNNVSS